MEIRRNPFRIPRGVDHVLSVRPVGPSAAAECMVVRIWHDGRIENVSGPAPRSTAVEAAHHLAADEKTVYLRAPDDVPQVAPPIGSGQLIFGDIPGVQPGDTFRSRRALIEAGLHRNEQMGIDWGPAGAAAIVFSGGYADDLWLGSEAWYTGQGGQDARRRQVADQQDERGNKALKENHKQGLPVRVIRKVDDGGAEVFVYEGLYDVVDYVYEPSRDGPKVFRFYLRRCD